MKFAFIVLALVVAGCAGRFAAAQPPSSSGPDPDAFRISVAVDLVVLQMAVRDREGHAAGGLSQEDFEVFEDGAPQHIRLFRHEDAPVTVGLVIDHSSSMQGKITDVIAGARAFVRSSNPDDQMFVVNFNETVSLGLPQTVRFSNSAEQLGIAIGKAPALGQTALYDAIIAALKRLQDGTRDKKVVIVISDGGDNASSATLQQVLKMTEQSSATIYTIGVFDPDDLDQNPRVLHRLAQETGGQAFFPEKLGETAEICERIARDIRDQYTIGYSSTNEKRDGVYRRVRVTARAKGGGKLSVRTRAGYSTGGGLPPGRNPAAK